MRTIQIELAVQIENEVDVFEFQTTAENVRTLLWEIRVNKCGDLKLQMKKSNLWKQRSKVKLYTVRKLRLGDKEYSELRGFTFKSA